MKRIFSNTFVALAAGLCLRLYFVLQYPANSGDTVLYEQIATNWLKHHVYAMTVGGKRISASLASVELFPSGKGTRLVYTEQGQFFDGIEGPKQREQGCAELLEKLDEELKRSAS